MGQQVKKKPFAKRVRFKNGAWRYRVPPWVSDSMRMRVFGGKNEVTLGVTESAAIEKWTEYMREMGVVRSAYILSEWFDRFRTEFIPHKKPGTQRQYIAGIKRLRPIFGHMPPEDFKSGYATQYLKRNDNRRWAQQVVETLKSVFTFIIECGDMQSFEHPLRGFKLKKERTKRTRSPTLDEIAHFLEVANSKFLSAYCSLKVCTGPRKAVLLGLRLSSATAEGIVVKHNKGGKDTIYTWLDPDTGAETGRREAWKACLRMRPSQPPPYLFVTREGNPYLDEHGQTSAFDSVWQRAMAKFVEAGGVRFTEHDIRRTVANKAASLEAARRLLGHQTTKTTEEVYRTGPEKA